MVFVHSIPVLQVGLMPGTGICRSPDCRLFVLVVTEDLGNDPLIDCLID